MGEGGGDKLVCRAEAVRPVLELCVDKRPERARRAAQGPATTACRAGGGGRCGAARRGCGAPRCSAVPRCAGWQSCTLPPCSLPGLHNRRALNAPGRSPIEAVAQRRCASGIGDAGTQRVQSPGRERARIEGDVALQQQNRWPGHETGCGGCEGGVEGEEPRAAGAACGASVSCRPPGPRSPCRRRTLFVPPATPRLVKGCIAFAPQGPRTAPCTVNVSTAAAEQGSGAQRGYQAGVARLVRRPSTRGSCVAHAPPSLPDSRVTGVNSTVTLSRPETTVATLTAGRAGTAAPASDSQAASTTSASGGAAPRPGDGGILRLGCVPRSYCSEGLHARMHSRWLGRGPKLAAG